MTVRHLARAERADLLAFLRGLTPEQWEAPSLCAGWRVRDVVAHVVSYEGLGGRELARRLARGRLRPARTNAGGGAGMERAAPGEPPAQPERHREPEGPTTGVRGRG